MISKLIAIITNHNIAIKHNKFNNTHLFNSFCSIVIDGLLIASTKGDDLFDTISATAKKAIRKIEDYSQQQKVGTEIFL